ncbi:HAD family hydrolase [Streptomyces platensis]|uniref:HAD family hydrolase n=1 Tax=Streptomyces platensis TaxID=58346 RepID=A0AAE6NL65_STRPT|nr:HAD family hydrolase [Streptomyces platensis]OSY34617.1 Phosphoglycolate phosphatase [Streptomyces platensis]QEV53825.1 HAD family hydrolase [Streptomyces platensis]
MDGSKLSEVIGATEGVLFDFDGPICDVFAGRPATGVARELAEVVAGHDPTLGGKAHGVDDPMEILRLSMQGGELVIRAIEEALTKAEVSAVKVAGPPIPGAVAALEAAHSSGRRVAVVSNNSTACVQAFLMLHGLRHLVHEVVGRAAYRPDLMKPEPHSLLLTAVQLRISPNHCTLIGDSVTDVEAARAAGAMSIGFANKQHKELALAEAGADVVVTDMARVAVALVGED